MDIFILRALERLAIVISAVIFAYLGYRLFLFGVKEGSSKLQTESMFFKITFSGTGPGLFFMAFGALVLMFALFTGDVFQIKPSTPGRGSIIGTGDPSRIDPETAGEAVMRGKTVTGAGASALTTRSGRLLSMTNLPPPSTRVESIKRGLQSEEPSTRIKALNRILELNEDELPHIYKKVEDISKNDDSEDVRKAAEDVLNSL